PVQEHGVDRSVLLRAERGRRCDAAVREVAPRALPRLQAHGGELAAVRREVDAPVADDGRELDEAAGPVPPHLAEGRRETDGHGPAVLGVVAVLRPLDARDRRRLRRRGRRRQRELLRRGAADVRLRLQAVDDDRRDDAGDEDGGDGEDDDQAPHDGGLRYPGDVKVPSGCVTAKPAEFAARNVACHVPGGSATASVAASGWRPRSIVCGAATPAGSTRSTAAASHGVPGSTAAQASVAPSNVTLVRVGAVVSQWTTSGASATVRRLPA